MAARGVVSSTVDAEAAKGAGYSNLPMVAARPAAAVKARANSLRSAGAVMVVDDISPDATNAMGVATTNAARIAATDRVARISAWATRNRLGFYRCLGSRYTRVDPAVEYR